MCAEMNWAFWVCIHLLGEGGENWRQQKLNLPKLKMLELEVSRGHLRRGVTVILRRAVHF